MRYKLTRRICGLLLPLLVLSAASLKVQAQEHPSEQYSFTFRGASLSQALEAVAEKTETDMVYDPAIVEGISVYSRVEDQTVPQILRDVLGATSLDFITLSSGTIVIVRKVSDDPSYGSYSGKIVDSYTGEPLPGATVRLANASGGTSTGKSGRFVLDNLVSGSYSIIFSYVGYEAVYKTIEIGPRQDYREEVEMEPKSVDFLPIVVTGHLPQVSSKSTDNGQSVDPGNEWTTTGRMEDAIRSLNLFSGVQYGSPMMDFHLQGGQRGEHRIMLDNVPVYNPYSFGQMFSAFSPYAISKVQLYKAGYGTPEGSQIAGLINLQHDVTGIDDRDLTFQADPLSLNLRGNLYWSDDEEESSFKVMGAARSNYWNVYREPNLENTLRRWDDLDPLMTNLLVNEENDAALYEPLEHNSDVRFYDVHLASEYEIDSYKTLSSSFYVGENDVSTDMLRQALPSNDIPEYLYAQDAYHWNNFMGQATYSQLVSPRLDMSTQLSFSSNQFNHRYLLGTNSNPTIPVYSGLLNAAPAQEVYEDFKRASENNLVPNQRSRNSIKHLIYRTDGTYSFTPQLNFEAGVQFDYVKSEVNLSDLFYLPTLSDQQSSLLSSYLKGNWVSGEYWKFSLGSRLTYVNTAGRFYTEPRGSIQFDKPDSGIGYWSVKFSGGVYRQFINQFEITNPGPTSLVPSFTIWSHASLSAMPEAWHISNSFHFEPSDHTTLNLEWFYKWQPTTYTVSYENLLEDETIDRSGMGAFAQTTEMENLGVGLRLHQSIANRKGKVILGYDFNHNRINLDNQFGRVLPASWSEPHRFQLRTLWHIFPELTAVAQWQSILGRSWGFRQSYYNYLLYEGSNRFGEYDFTHPEDDRLAPFHQFDLSFVYSPSLSMMDMELRLDLINLLDRRNTIDWRLQPIHGEEEGDQYEIKKRSMPGFHPSISIQFNM
ncbi:Outer membrane receptor proteins, mostly Fe transport [Fodinibius roseus]|uniref:Outer membrane receptor proteins, mostly Fe transport n=1 Tax=Fodinibius roseus TaxID=1194090 RepID=A0A1M5HIY3_9BACT|nr:carboxypeptidase-like regulatory domain-containing protein [Fodinibius roseus]SHG15887.1 Outer membrane receptor proteins, mostly Fe transport [Fodinibius roseus]